MRHIAARLRRFSPGFTVVLALAGLAIVTLRAAAPQEAQSDFYYFDGAPVSLRRSQTEVVVRFVGNAQTAVSRLAQTTPGLHLASQAANEGRDFDVLSVGAQVVSQAQPQAGQPRILQVQSPAVVGGQSPVNVAPPAGVDIGQLLQTLRSDPTVEFVAPVFHYPPTGIRILPTDELIVRLKPGDSETAMAGFVAGFGLTVDRPIYGTVDQFVLRMTDGKGAYAMEVSRRLHETGRFQWAQPNFLQEYQKFDVPNDPLFANQWHLNNTGQGGGDLGSDSALVAAWDIEDGNGNIVIAIVDDGIEKTHEDLSAAIFVNPGEIPANGVDDDANGKIDDVSGWDFSNNDNNASPFSVDDNHGTAVAGVAAARGNNAIGVSGACRNCRLLPVKIFSPGYAGDAATGAAINYAALFADVINNSWGGGTPVAVIEDAINLANTSGRGGKGSVVMAATGNSATGLRFWGLPATPAGTHKFRFEYAKNASQDGGLDTGWLAWVIPPTGAPVFFNAPSLPAGWSTGGDSTWATVLDPTHTDEGICQTRAAKPGDIGDNQATYLDYTGTFGAGQLLFYYWSSSQLNLDGLFIRVDLNNDGSFNANYLVSGIDAFNQAVAFPASHPGSVAVGASSNFDCRSAYSQFGPQLAFVAPSNAGPFNLGITTTDRTGTSGYNTAAAPAGNYTNTFGGTSSATPLASGIAALVLSRSPGLPRAEVIEILKNSADKEGPEPYVAGRNDRYGHGRLNAHEALLDTPVVPGAPTAVVATGGNAQASVAFTAPSNGGSPITNYKVTSSPGGFIGNGASSPVVVGGLTNGVSYTFVVAATNIAGTGPNSSASNAVTPSSGPGAFNKITPAHTATGQPVATVLTWGAASGATSYEYCIDTSNNNACNTSWVSVGNNTSVGLAPLPASTAHYWHVRAINGGGTTYSQGDLNSFWAFTTGAASGPFGQVDSPIQNAAGVQGSIGFTGWVLDDIQVTQVQIFRNCLGGFDAVNCQMVQGQNVVFVGNASFVPGARPDVEAAFPTHPFKNRAGWGYLMLTLMLPHVTNSQPYGGQGPITIYAIATDSNGNKQILGRTSNTADVTPTSMTMTNDTIAVPFGGIDTPTQGQTISGVFHNFGWALTPDSNTIGGEGGDILMPTNGSTMVVYIDALPVGTVAYNQCRGSVGNPVPGGIFCNDDVANIFGNATAQPPLTTRLSNPTKYRNLDAERGAIGAYTFNTAALSNGLHTIQWGVTDSAARGAGLGSRYFTVSNGLAQPLSASAAMALTQSPVLAEKRVLDGLTPVTEGVWGRTGFSLSEPWRRMHADDDGTYAVRLPESGRLELWLGPVDAGYLVANDTLRQLPVGSTLLESRFAWMPPPGYIGPYHLSFVRAGKRIDVTVTVVEKPRAVDGEAQIRMHLDAAVLGASGVGDALAERGVRLDGWAFDPQAAIGSGIGAVHVWAMRTDIGGQPFFLGSAALDQARPDLARSGEGAPSHSGFSLTATLAPGRYVLTAYAWNERTGRWEDARTVQVAVR